MVSAIIKSYLNLEKKYVAMAAPICFLISVQIGLAFVTVVFAGMIDEHTLAGVGLGNTFYNVFQYSVMYGYSSIMDTYGPQVYGSKEKKHLGTVLLKVISQGFLVWLTILGPYLNLVYLMRVVEPHEEPTTEGIGSYALVIEKAVLYLRITCIIGLLDFAYDVLSKYLTIQNLMGAVYCSASVMVGSHILFNYILTVQFDFGIYGLGLACILTRCTTLSCVCLYIVCKRSSMAWAGFSSVVCLDWSEMIKLGVSGAVNVFAEMGMYEIATFFSQFDGIIALNSIIIIFQYNGLSFSVSMGIAYSASVLIGKALADQNKESAIKIRNLAILNVSLAGPTMALLFFGLRFQMPKMFTKDESVIKLTASVMWVVAMTCTFENLQTCLARGILTGLGKQRFIAVVLVIICYGISTPFIIATVFLTNLGPKGILLGFLTFGVLSTCVCGIKVAKVDFDEEMQKVKDRVTLTAGNVQKVGMNVDDGVVIDGNTIAINTIAINPLAHSENNFQDLSVNNNMDGQNIEETANENDTITTNLVVIDNHCSSTSSLVLKKMLLFLVAGVWTGVLAGVSFLQG